MVDHFRLPAFEVEAFSSNAVQTFYRLVQPKMGPDFTLNRTCTYDTIIWIGNMVLVWIELSCQTPMTRENFWATTPATVTSPSARRRKQHWQSRRFDGNDEFMGKATSYNSYGTIGFVSDE